MRNVVLSLALFPCVAALDVCENIDAYMPDANIDSSCGLLSTDSITCPSDCDSGEDPVSSPHVPGQ